MSLDKQMAQWGPSCIRRSYEKRRLRQWGKILHRWMDSFLWKLEVLKCVKGQISRKLIYFFYLVTNIYLLLNAWVWDQHLKELVSFGLLSRLLSRIIRLTNRNKLESNKATVRASSKLQNLVLALHTRWIIHSKKERLQAYPICVVTMRENKSLENCRVVANAHSSEKNNICLPLPWHQWIAIQAENSSLFQCKVQRLNHAVGMWIRNCCLDRSNNNCSMWKDHRFLCR